MTAGSFRHLPGSGCAGPDPTLLQRKPPSLNNASAGIPLTLVLLEANRCKVMDYDPSNIAIRSGAVVQTAPSEEEFFIEPSDNELNARRVASRVRESVQKDLDARVGAAQVGVTFKSHKSQVLMSNALRYLARLKPWQISYLRSNSLWMVPTTPFNVPST